MKRSADLLGRRVVVIGLRDDTTPEVVSALAEAGATVLTIDVGGGLDEEPLPRDAVDCLREAGAHGGTVELVSDFEGARIASALWDGLWPELWASFGARMGQSPDAVVLGRLAGFIEDGVGEQVARSVAEAGAELVVIEASSDDCDHSLRWFSRWALEAGLASLTVLRDTRGEPQPAFEAGATAAVLASAGWPVVLLEDADRHAAALRASGRDPLAGRMWRVVGGGDAERGILALADSAADLAKLVTSAERDPGAEHVIDDGATAAIVSLGDAIDYAIAVTPLDGPADGVRIIGDTDAFDGPATCGRVTEIAVPSGRLVVADLLYDDPMLGASTVEVVPGRWTIERVTGDQERIGLRARVTSSPL